MKHLLLLAFGILFSFSLLAQQRIVHGNVTVFKTMSLGNIKVVSKNTGSAVTTDTLGYYEVLCDQKDVLTFSGITFSTKKVRVKPGKEVFNVDMKFLPNPENVEMAVGYGYITKEKATTAFANLTRNQVDFCSYNNIYELIAGRCAGVSVGPKGLGGGSEQQIIVRGVSSINQGNPLFIVDGVPTSQIASIQPCDVRSISFLKDAEAAIYGAQSAFGVILINTRTGNK